ncbi:DUF3319 domain-containing protein [Photobacterium phosphoreum]|uniref:DUF3319 domain-containing protein n=1 Tax=Photobacterium phosphoreum TaxID=659 RepID=A0A2T3K8W5_PHOPO|nr:DUF3319 domain-containing protein [Photobacterium phosphoreum]PSU20283.1 DUF3319 domain-containing protein [Photobacterium phosphoreum]PSU38993.1 DUF3319 domain-containing protein [Photobacterium phosphoreum]PSU46410.1 DUF3319 domain-containing protein [Photobacterium phosphoreum]PSU73043.1 DUF3319 domain-containing protein [Photobacterium phosphoreum]PSW33470.1 DUF3319 domain-containing protein [Photobacterium phosphoreum]
MKKRLFHRGYIIENSTGLKSDWKTVINGRSIQGMLTNIKKSVDWWCDTKAFMPPERFNAIQQADAIPSLLTTEHYRGIVLKNDSGKGNEWYAIVRGQLLKGDAISIKKYLDKISTN